MVASGSVSRMRARPSAASAGEELEGKNSNGTRCVY